MRTTWMQELRFWVVGAVLALCGAAACTGGHDDESVDAVAVRLSPVRVDVTEPSVGGGASSPWALFDRDVQVGWSPRVVAAGEPARVRVALAAAAPITHLKVFGASPYVLDVRTSSGAAIRGLEHVRLDQLAAGWNTLRVPEPALADELVLELASIAGGLRVTDPTAALGEIELWGIERPSRPLDARTIATLAGSLPPAAPPGVDLVLATDRTAIDLGPRAEAGAHACATVRFALTRSPASYRRAWMAYVADGAFRSFVLTRSLNAGAVRSGRWFSSRAASAPLVDPIDPEALVPGDNRYDVCLPDDAAAHVVLHDVVFIGELDRGSNAAVSAARGPIDGVATETVSELLDPDHAASAALRPGERLIVAMDRWVSPDAVVLRNATGAWAVDCLDDAGHARELAPSDVAAGPERTVIALGEAAGQLACAAIALRPSGGAGASLSNVTVIGSGARARVDWPTITLASPAEHFGLVAWVDGWVSAPRALGETTSVEIQTTDLGATRVFGSFLSRTGDADKPWSVTVTARFAAHPAVHRTFLLDSAGAIGNAGALEATLGGLSAAEKAARFGTPGQLASRLVQASGAATQVRLGSDVGVDIPAGALTTATTIAIKHLVPGDVPPLDPGLVNVTAPDAHGFELTPHGQLFKQPIDVLVPYDPALLPPGYTADDVRTYYFDTAVRRWRSLSRARLDDKQRIVHSASDHFTTVINAVVVSPEHPEIRQFNPNELSGIKAADPGAGIRLIDPPTPSSHGDASLSYSFDLPAGRRGLTPALGLSYNSSRGNSWVGVGWDLPISAVTVDTRFGAARYDCDLETETYALDGEQLTPVAHRGPDRRRSDETTVVDGETVKIFHTRVEGGFRKIIRHGATTRDYWWEVVDKTGTRSFFGATPQSGGPIDSATLRSNAGDVFSWALVEMRDLHGNAIRYEHEAVSSAGFAVGTVPGRTLYPRTIRYTFEAGAHDAPYDVTFLREARPDPMIDGRGGFKHVTAERLRRVEVHFQGALVRAWELAYTEGAFHKSLLASIQPFGASNTPFPGSAHRFDYFDEIRNAPTPDASFKGFAAAAPWRAGGEHIEPLSIPGPARSLLPNGEVSVLGGSGEVAGGGHLYLGFNPTLPRKPNSFGGKVGFRVSSTDEKLALIDINGDGLPDKVFDAGGGISYRLNQSGPARGTQFSDAVFAAAGLPSLSAHSSSMFSFGFEAYPGPASLIFNVSETLMQEDRYFADVNGDGLLDLVEPGTVHFNTHTPSGAAFVANDSGATPLPIVSGAIDPSDVVPDLGGGVAADPQHFPLIDAVRRWTAPYAGTIQITGAAQLRAGSPPGDGARVAIQLNGSELWSATIAPGDSTPKSPDGVSAIHVNADDRIYFRTSALSDPRDHVVDWDPVVEYTGVAPLADPNQLSERVFQASSDFVLAGRDGTVLIVPFDGVIKLAGTVTKAATTDSVTLEVSQTRTGEAIANPVFSLERDPGSTQPFAVDQTFSVKAGDKLEVRFKIDSPIDLTALGISPATLLHWQYVSATRQDGQPVTVFDETGKPLEIAAPFDMDTYGLRAPMAEQPTYIAPQSGTLRVFASVSAAPNTPVDFTIKRPGAFVAKRGFTSSGTVEVDVPVAQGDALFFDFSTREQSIALFTILTEARVTFDPDAATGELAPRLLHYRGPTERCPQRYRGWTYAGLNATKIPPGTPIPDDVFCHEPSSFDQSTPVPGDIDAVRNQGQQVNDDTLTVPLIPFPAGRSCLPNQACDLPHVPLWGAADDEVYILPAASSASRQGPDDLRTPTGDTIVHGTTVSRLSRTTQTAESVGALVLSASNSDGAARGVVDYIDMNGDGFPDVVGHGAIQYTSAHGTVGGATCTARGSVDPVRASTTSSQSLGIGGTVAQHAINPRGRGGDTGGSPGNGAGTSTQMVSIGLSLNGNVGGSGSDAELLDINGDGLPDRVFRTGGLLLVALNVGYGFLDAEPFGGGAINAGNSVEVTVGASLGFNEANYEFAGGASASLGESGIRAFGPLQSDGESLVDVNGDGLIDRVVPSGGALQVGINTGAGFAPLVPWNGVPTGDVTHSANLSVGGGVYFTIGIPLCVLACYLIINPGAEFSTAMNRQEVALRDIDGDGFPDLLSSNASDQLVVASSLIGKTNLLHKVTRPLGATLELDYTREGNTFEQPHNQFALSRVVMFDGIAGDWRPENPGADFQLTTYAYDGGFYDRREREFYGYATVVSTMHDTRGLVGGVPDDFDKPYLRTTRTYQNDSFFAKNLMLSEVIEGVDTSTPRRFSQIENHYALREVASQQVLTTPVAVAETLSSVFPELRTTIRRRSEGDASASVQTEVDQSYDADGNMIQIVDRGDAGAQDDYTATMTYTGHGGAHAGCEVRHIIGLADSITVRAADGTVLRHRESSFDCSTADLIELRQATEGLASAVSNFEYASNGNLVVVAGPENLRGQRYTLGLAYDTATQSHVVSLTDSFGTVSTSDYDLRFGTIRQDTDGNGNSIFSTYDDFGRLSTIVGPFEAGTGLSTVQFEYHPERDEPYARTANIDVFRGAGDPIETLLFTDGLKRTIQTKKDATIHRGKAAAPADAMTVSGCVAFDQVSRTFETRYPTTEPKGADVNFAFDRNCDTKAPPTTTSFDVLGRPLLTTLPDGASIQMAYAIAPDRQGQPRLTTTTIDALGTKNAGYKDIKDRLLALQQFNASKNEVIWTEYEYDAVDQLRRVRDDHGNLTSVTYDLAGRTRSVDSPDAGKLETVYDAAGNVTRKITANLRASSRAIAYDYDFTRVIAIHYPSFPENDVSYEYGSAAQLGQPGNRVGRIVKVTDASGSEVRAYDKLGELVEETKTVASKTQGNSDNSPEVWTTRYLYDTWGRLQQMTYPDGEVLTYAYDAGGMVRAATGVKLGVTTPYMPRLEYDELGQRAFLSLGNGVETSYAYDPRTRFLSRLTAGDFQDLNYTYDPVGNITALSNRVAIPAAKDFGGPVDQTFAYDGLYRLTHATGEWRFSPNKRNNYALSLAYDTVHNITRKTQTNTVTNNGGSTVTQKPTTYDFGYAYTGPRPHAATTIGERAFSYDANGNQTGWDDLTSGQRRTIVWDDESRIHEISDNGRTTHFVYDDAGQRVIKRGAQGETAYVNQFWTVRNRSVATKHIFAGEIRIASKVIPGNAHLDPNSSDPFTAVLGQWWQHRSEQGWQNGNNTVQNPHYAGNRMPDILPEDNFVYFFHPDHLGSTSFATAATGDLFEHLEYFPFGETWVSEQTNTQRLPFLFTGKELDEETQLYYFGARYYDPRTSVWQSPDPFLARYFTGESVRGVYTPGNLALYTYALSNPLILGDPTGAVTEPGFWEGLIPIWGSGRSAVHHFQEGNWGRGTFYAAMAISDVFLVKSLVVAGGKLVVGGGLKVAAEETVVLSEKVTLTETVEQEAKATAKVVEETTEVAKATKGETAATKAGRKAHKDWDPGEGFEKEVRLPSGKQADAVNMKERVVKELKPNNPRAIKRGEKQVEGYRKELEEMTKGTPGEPWKGKVETYDPKP